MKDVFFIGNDLVDLCLPENQAKVQNKRWLNKIFVPAEQHLIEQATEPNTMAWLLWSCKESTYKVAIKQGMLPNYRPLDFVVELDTPQNHLICAKVHHPTGVCYTQSAQNTHLVHSIAAPKAFVLTHGFVHTHKFTDLVDALPTKAWHLPLLQAIALQYGFDAGTLSIQKQLHNVPVLCQNGQVLSNFDISLSHDGVWAGGIFLKCKL